MKDVLHPAHKSTGGIPNRIGGPKEEPTKNRNIKAAPSLHGRSSDPFSHTVKKGSRPIK